MDVPGPDSVSWRVNREIVMLAGWSAAVLLQLAHPLVLAGVLDHSVFVADPSRRLERANETVQSFLLLAFGTERQIQQTADKINAIHDYVHGQLRSSAGQFVEGTPYSAHDPELLRWVHATLADVLPRTYELLLGPLSECEKEAYCAEAATVGPLLGLAPGDLPDTMAALREYMAGAYASGAIAVTNEARELARIILRPPLPVPGWLTWVLGPVLPLIYWANAVPTLGLLPPAIRSAYGFRWTPFQEACFLVGGWLSRRLIRFVPPLMRQWASARR